jgi:hypothetical protein
MIHTTYLILSLTAFSISEYNTDQLAIEKKLPACEMENHWHH